MSNNLKSFLQFPREEQAAIIVDSALNLGTEPHVIEKDLWVCWSLQQLFALPNHLPMAFKGGTALSKVYQVIHRFSEDIDISIDYSAFNNELKDPFASGISKTAQKKLSDNLRKQLAEYVQTVIKPYFEKIIADDFDGSVKIEVDSSGEKFSIKYPSVMPNSYLKDGVLLEFGARNITTPNEKHTVKTFLSQLFTDEQLSLPIAEVPVLSTSRTFWEKVTLIHVECNKNKPVQYPPYDVPFLPSVGERYSRHWYDLAKLFNHELGKQALIDRTLFKEVVKHKKVFFNSATANYDACLEGSLRLVPDTEILLELEHDYKSMIANGMFFAPPPAFSEVIKELHKLETLINNQTNN